jgi:hypothetical protein
MKRTRIAFLFATLSLALAPSAPAALILSFDQSNYNIFGLGNTGAVQVFLSQTADGPQVGPGNELLTAGIELTFATGGTAIVASSADVAASPLWDSSSVNITTDGGNTLVDLGLTSLAGIADLSNPILLGTFTFTGQSFGATNISVATLGPGPSFITAQGDVLDPTGAAIAGVTVIGVPEPSAMLMASLGGLLSAAGLRWFRRPR